MSPSSLPPAAPVGRVPFLNTLRGVLYLNLSQALGRSLLTSYLLPLLGVFGVTFALALEPTRASFEGWLIDLFLLMALPIIALSVSGGLLRDEIKDGTMEYLWTRPTSRLRLLLCFYIAAVLKTLAYALALALSIYAAGILKGCHVDLALLPSLFLAIIFSALTFSAGGLLLATWSGKYMIIGITYGVLVESGLGRIPTNLSRFSVRHSIETIVQLDGFSGLATTVSSLGVCLLLAVVCLGGAGLIFSMKDYALGEEKDG